MTWALLPAAGSGQRFGGEVPKQYLQAAGKPLIVHALDALLAHPGIDGVVVALAAGDTRWPGWTTLHGKPIVTCIGGGERADSVLAALQALPAAVANDELLLVHDAARPNLRADDISRLIDAAIGCEDGAILAAPVRDTLKRADAESRIASTLPRDPLWRALTPQAFRRDLLRRALEAAKADGVMVTDEAMAVERLGLHPHLVEGREDNLKVTTPADMALAEFLLARHVQARRFGATESRFGSRRSGAPTKGHGFMSIRIGQGFDVHAFGTGDHVMLGGVRVPHDRGVLAHSDGDVALHALCDAILGALALGDIGRHFPPSDPQWKDADSRVFLRHCDGLIRACGWRVGNCDITVICERPKVGPHAKAMRECIASDLGIDLDAVSVKATTTETLGFTGRGEGIAAQAVCLLVPLDD